VPYFTPVIVAKADFLFFGINHDIGRMIALAFFTAAIGLSEEIYFRGIMIAYGLCLWTNYLLEKLLVTHEIIKSVLDRLTSISYNWANGR
jgi:hypothetical protein